MLPYVALLQCSIMVRINRTQTQMYYIAPYAQQNLRQSFSLILTTLLFLLLIMTGGRFAILYSFAQDAFASLTSQEQINFWVLGLRFDLKVAMIFVALPMVLTIFCCWFKWFRHLLPWLNIFAHLTVLITFAFAIINYFYFKTYGTSIDSFIFAMMREDPKAVVNTIINDYPVITGGIAIVVTCLIYWYLVKFCKQVMFSIVRIPQNIATVSVLLVVCVLLFVIGIRGSFGTFPLRQLNAQICDKAVINSNIANGVQAFYWAYSWHKKSLKLPTVTLQQIADTYQVLGITIDAHNPVDLFRPLKQTSARNDFIVQHQPNIVFNLMESMGLHLYTYDDPQKLDLLGALRQHIKSDMFFTNFVSEGDGTSDTLMRLLVSAPDGNLSTSPYAKKKYVTNIIQVMKQAGYETIFITGASSAWRNLEGFLTTLGVDKIIERSNIQHDFPNATEGAWGFDDEFMFQETLKVLQTPHDKPLFIMTLSNTNHPPYRLPNNVQDPQLQLDAKTLARFPYDNTTMIFTTYWYANNELGKFISAVKHDPTLKEQTIIAATGDHNLRGIKYGNHPRELAFGHAVPFYLYMPKAYQGATNVQYDPQRYGSHKDIIPTILAHATSEVTYYTFGCDLLSTAPCTFPYMFNRSVMKKEGSSYICDLDNTRKHVNGTSFALDQSNGLYVSTKAAKYDCAQEVAMRRLSQQLYYYQAHLKEEPAL